MSINCLGIIDVVAGNVTGCGHCLSCLVQIEAYYPKATSWTAEGDKNRRFTSIVGSPEQKEHANHWAIRAAAIDAYNYKGAFDTKPIVSSDPEQEKKIVERMMRERGIDPEAVKARRPNDAEISIIERARALEAERRANAERKHSAYFKPCPYNTVDVYRVLQLFGVTDPCIQHAIKKLLVAGGRGGGKDITRDIQETIDALLRWEEMRVEEKNNG